MTQHRETYQDITVCLWFDGDAEAAVDFYASIFSDTRITSITRYGKAAAQVSGKPEGSVLTIAFELRGHAFLALNGGPEFRLTPAISFIVYCDNQEEVDAFWEKLSEGGEILECGWLTDKFGVTWQIVPRALEDMLKDEDAEKTERVMRAMLTMKKLDLGILTEAYEGREV